MILDLSPLYHLESRAWILRYSPLRNSQGTMADHLPIHMKVMESSMTPSSLGLGIFRQAPPLNRKTPVPLHSQHHHVRLYQRARPNEIDRAKAYLKDLTKRVPRQEIICYLYEGVQPARTWYISWALPGQSYSHCISHVKITSLWIQSMTTLLARSATFVILDSRPDVRMIKMSLLFIAALSV